MRYGLLLALLWASAASAQSPALAASGTKTGTGDGTASGVLNTFPAVTGHTSSRYSVTVSQGTPESSPVLFGTNESGIADNSDANHWTVFEYEGANVEIVVTDLTGEITTATIRPTDHGITPTVDTVNDTVTFTITETGYYYVDTGDYEDPLFIFAEPPEENVPNCADANVTCYAAGIHNLDPTTDGNLSYTKTTFNWGDTVYIEGGAWVQGLLEVSGGSGTFKLMGRGTLSGDIYNWVSGNVQRKLLFASSSGSGNMVVEGVTFTDPPTHAFVTYDPGLVVNNIKMFGFHRTSDGLRLNDNSSLTRSFFKVNDDWIKLYGSNITVDDVVGWHQKIGSAFQLSFNLSANETNTTVDNVDIIHADRPNSASPGNYTQSINNSVIASRNFNGADFTNFTFSNIRFEKEVWQIFGLWLKWDNGFHEQGDGSITGFNFTNFDAPNGQTTQSYFHGNGATAGDVIESLNFTNVEIDGVDLSAADENTKFTCDLNCDSSTFTFAP